MGDAGSDLPTDYSRHITKFFTQAHTIARTITMSDNALDDVPEGGWKALNTWRMPEWVEPIVSIVLRKKLWILCYVAQ